VNVRRRNGSVEAENDRIRARVDLDTMEIAVASAERATRIDRARVGLESEGRTVLASRAKLDGQRELDTQQGRVTRLEIRSEVEPSLGLALEIDLADDWPGMVLRLSAENRGRAPVRVGRLVPFRLGIDDETLRLPFDDAATRFLRMGYQSWTPAEYVTPGVREPRPRLAFVKRMHEGPFTPRTRRGLHVSDFVTTLRAPDTSGLTLGFLSHDRYLDYVTLEHRGGPRTLEASVATEDLPLLPGERLEGERLWIGLDPADSDGVAEWAARTGREMGAPVPREVGSAWCSWYQFFTRVSADDVRRNLEGLAPLRADIETVQIDDGFQAAVGDWLEWDPGFPEGLAPLAAEIRDAGFGAGIWLAPFLVSRASRVARTHPGWLLRGATGRPIVANVNPGWKGVLCYALDPTHPEVQAWLAEVVTTLNRYGFEYFKLDFLYAGALAGRRYAPGRPSAAAYREGIRAMRDAAGPGAFFLGCGAPLGPSVGLFEAMRIGADVAPKWRSRGEDTAAGLPAAPSARNAVRNVLSRAALHQRLWVNDPDCILLRDRDTRLSEDEVRTVAASALVSGGLLVLSDDLGNLSPGRQALLRQLFPPVQGLPTCGPIEGGIPTTLVQRGPDGSVLCLAVNLDDAPLERSLDPARLGLGGPVHAYDVWTDRYLGAHSGPVRLEPIPAHGCALVRLVPADGRPRLVGSSLHLGGGLVEAVSVEKDDEGRVRIRLALPGERRGRVLVDDGSGRPLPVHVRFESALELSAAGVQIQDSPADRSG
jgi:alpha-galactosidase